MTEGLVDSILSIVRQNESWAVPIAFLVALGESLCFLSIVWPGWAILTALAFLLAASGVDTTVMTFTIIAAGIGGVVGYSVSYWVGHYFKDSIGNVWPFTTHPTLIPRGQEFFEKHGAWSVFLGHFIGPVRAVIPVVAGMFAMPQVPFQIANVSSAFIWAIWAILWPVLFIAYKDPIFTFMREHTAVMAVLMFLLAFANGAALPTLFVATLGLFAFAGGVALFAGVPFWPLWLAGAAGAFCADLYFRRLGERDRRDFSKVWYVNNAGRDLAETRSDLHGTGPLRVITSKALWLQRALVPIAAGAEGMPLLPFAAASAVSALLWAAVLLIPGLVARAFVA
jgi:membrane protein DedA with SNARE-associated domain